MRRRQLLLAGILGAMVLPAAGADAAQACASRPCHTVQRYYHSIGAGRYQTAWSCLSSTTQSSFGGYANWRSGYGTTVTTRLSSISLREGTSTLAKIAVRLRSCRVRDGADLVERFAGTWDVQRRNGRWQLQRPRLSRTSSQRVSDC